LGADQPGDHLCFYAHHDIPDNFHHPPTLAALFDPGDHYSSRHHKPRTADLAGMKRLAEDFLSLALVA
jgi:hypothetical protein